MSAGDAPCPVCGAPPGAPCVTLFARNRRTYYHDARERAAAAAARDRLAQQIVASTFAP